MNAITRWSEIPEFADEAAEARFWENNELDGRLMASSVHTADSRESTTITLRFDPRMLSRIKRIARGRFLNYQSMMKQWLAERLEEEMRKQ
jgi:predicted DNA binding CopG/RHH family protein